MRGSWRFPLALIAISAGTHLAHRTLDDTELPENPSVEETLASGYATRLLSLGHYALAADYYWLRALGHFGDYQMHGLLYPNLEPFLDRATALDPYFASVYKLAGTALTLEGMDIGLSNRLLERGLEFRPEVWEIPFYLGFNYYYFERDFTRAAELFSRAAELEGAPPHTAGIATRLAAEAGRPEVGLAVVESMLEQLSEDNEESRALREEYEGRKKLLLLEVELNALNRALELYSEREGRPPRSLQDMVRSGVLSYVPEEPLGGEYRIEGERVVTSNEDKRLRLADNAKKELSRPPLEENAP